MRRFGRWLRRKLSSGYDVSSADAYKVTYEVYEALQRKKYDKARDLLLQALRWRDQVEDPAIADYLLTSLEGAFLLSDRYEEAISYFSNHITHYPQDSAACRGRAAALWYTGRLQEAVDDYSRALELKPSDIMSLSGRGQVLAELRESERAIDDLNLALEKINSTSHPDATWTKWYEQIEAFTRNGRAVALAGRGEHRLAMQEFELSISLSPDNAWVYYNRATILEELNERDKAFMDYQTALVKNAPALSPFQRERAKARLREIPS